MQREHTTPGGNRYWHREDGTIEMALTQGKTCILDAEDLGLIARLRWYAVKKDDIFYAFAHTYRDDGERRAVGMHTILLDHRWPGKAVHVDHRDRDGLNNRRANLRDATAAKNAANKKTGSANTSGFKGVSVNPKCTLRPFRALVQKGGRKVFSGQFATAEEAAEAYNEAAREHFGEFARLNDL